MSFGIICINFAAQTEFSLPFSIIFRPPPQKKFPFPECKSSISNNSGSKQDRTMVLYKIEPRICEYQAFGRGGSNGVTTTYLLQLHKFVPIQHL